jgi:amidophosphoribosyltransferase
MCGIVGAIAQQQSVTQDLYNALTIIQHRGQDAAGMITADAGKFFLRKGNGLVKDVMRDSHLRQLQGQLGLGHVRYPTAGSASAMESQPFYVNSPYGLSLVHNGNLTNAEALSTALRESDLRHLNTTSDSEVLLNVLAYELQHVAQEPLTHDALTTAVSQVYQRVQGAYSVIAMINGYGLIAFRDPHGIRPLLYGKRTNPLGGVDYLVASESIVLDALGYERIDDLAPGEMIFIDLQQQVHRFQLIESAQHVPCIFEYIYLARPDSVIDNICVYQARIAMGEALARQIQATDWAEHIDVVIPIPDTSRTAAYAAANVLNRQYCEGFVKNRYIGRTFIMPGQAMRQSQVRMKLNAIKQEFEGKNVLLIDDSIVRGTTSKEIVQMARDAGAKQVYFASAAPKITYPNVYGIDMPSREELIAYGRTEAEIAALIGADRLIYQTLTDACAAVNSAAKSPADQVAQFEDSIFTGRYITGDIDAAYFERLATKRAHPGQAQDKGLDPLDGC